MVSYPSDTHGQSTEPLRHSWFVVEWTRHASEINPHKHTATIDLVVHSTTNHPHPYTWLKAFGSSANKQYLLRRRVRDRRVRAIHVLLWPSDDVRKRFCTGVQDARDVQDVRLVRPVRENAEEEEWDEDEDEDEDDKGVKTKGVEKEGANNNSKNRKITHVLQWKMAGREWTNEGRMRIAEQRSGKTHMWLVYLCEAIAVIASGTTVVGCRDI